MHLVYLDESGQSGNNLNDLSQPIFVLAALVVPETSWLPVEQELLAAVARFFPPPRPDRFEIHATALRNGEGFFIDSASSLLTQLCDLCAYSARKKEEAEAGAALKPIDRRGVELITPLTHRGNEAFQDTMDWMIALQKERSGQGSNPGR